jgi:nucleotide-binding universal stress UspA family protein
MSVTVGHQVSQISAKVLAEAAREASYRHTDLVVIHMIESLDEDIAEANKAGISDSVERVLKEERLDVGWKLHLHTGVDDVAEAVLDQIRSDRSEVVVIGARRRSPVGKAFLGSVAQMIILKAEVPVLVVKRSA